MKNLGKIVGVAGLITCAVLPVKADSISFDLMYGNSAIASYPSPYAKITVDRTSSTTAKFTFQALTSPGWQYLFGDGSSVALNVNATSFTCGTVTYHQLAGFSSASARAITFGPQNVSQFGTFDFTIDSHGGFANAADQIVFTLTDVSGTWFDASDVLSANSDGSKAAGHIYVTTSVGGVKKSNGAVNTGYAGNGAPVPDGGSTVALLSLALLGLGSVRRFLKL